MTLFGCYCEAYPDLTIQTWVLLRAPSTNHFAISHLRRSIRFDRVAPEALVVFGPIWNPCPIWSVPFHQ